MLMFLILLSVCERYLVPYAVVVLNIHILLALVDDESRRACVLLGSGRLLRLVKQNVQMGDIKSVVVL